MLLVVAIISAYRVAQKEVNLLVDGKKWQVHTFYSDVAGVLQENGIDLAEKDRVNPGLDTALTDGMTVEVRRAVPVQLQVGNEKYHLLSSAKTVGEVLEEEGVVLGERDQVTPGLDTRLDKETSIQVDRITTKVVEEEVPIPYRIQREADNTLFSGIVRVINNGKEGLEKKIWEIVYKNGKEVEKKLLASTVIEEPVDRVVRVGTMRTVTRGGNTIRFSRAYDMVATAYTYTGNNTATGVSPRVGIVAVDPSVIPMGSRLYVEGYGYCTAMDKGRAIRGNRIDVFLESRSQALSWGRRTVKVYLLE
ncbi:3D domain-containing protein [Desulfallas thermosapovorans]|uniref:Uncharacterized protein DUF348 n=1 Tax=Desulfallas thermosapovorans DSM 6562 TaxID=1121431 RepID=A0A5S4ZVI2_9FIRM|nr:3D domain-containing protein [Desulfallas thermosapovorans]TYO97001.1 uncharacterized protein DUF348 [Desulfallas thermosapovorans DSM 6562]